MDWIRCGLECAWSSWIVLDWVSELVDWAGLDLTKWTHVQLWLNQLLETNCPTPHDVICQARRCVVSYNQYTHATAQSVA